MGPAWERFATARFRWSAWQLSETVTREFEAIGTHLVREFGLIGLFGIDAVVASEMSRSGRSK